MGGAISILSVLLLDYVLPLIHLDINLSMMLIGRFSFLPLLSALGLFLIFKRVKFSSIFINKMAQSAFAVYLISENPNVYSWFWKTYLDNIDYYNSAFMIPIAMIQSSTVLLVCIIVDMLYKNVKTII